MRERVEMKREGVARIRAADLWCGFSFFGLLFVIELVFKSVFVYAFSHNVSVAL